MLGPIRWVVWAVVRVLLTRYRVAVRGLAEARRRPGPYLILPNHPGFIDPPNLLVCLWPAFRMRPMLLETNFENPVLAPFAWLLRGIRVPDTERASAEARDRAEGAVRAAIDALKAGENVIVPPSGRLMRDGVERLGGARTVADVLAAVPDVTVVLVRTRGLWGSSFSWARGTLSLGKAIVRGAGLLLANLLLFAPRRRVSVTVEAFGPAARPEPTREKVNRWLEGWFNGDVPREEPTFAPPHFLFGPRTFTFPPPPVAAGVDPSKVNADVRRAVTEIVEEKLKRPLAADENTADTTFVQLGLDSLDAMEVTLQVEQRFGFTGDTVPTAVGQLWALAAGLLEGGPPKPPPAGWFDRPADANRTDVPGTTLPAAILTHAFRHPRRVIAADDLAGGGNGREAGRRRVGDGPPVPRGRRPERRAHAPGLGRRRPGVPRAAPGRQAAGRSQLDDRAGQPDPRRPRRRPDPRDHVEGLHRPDPGGGAGGGVPVPRRRPGRDGQARIAPPTAGRPLVAGPDEGPAAGPDRGRPARPGRGPVHERVGEGPEGRPADARQRPGGPAGGRQRVRPDAGRRGARVPPDVPQLRAGRDLAAPAGGRHAGRPPPGPDRRRGPGPQGGRLPADPPGRHPDIPRVHPRPGQARRPRLGPAGRVRGRGRPAGPVREGEAAGPDGRRGRGVRDHGDGGRRRRSPAGEVPDGDAGRAAAGRGGARRRPGDGRAAAAGGWACCS